MSEIISRKEAIERGLTRYFTGKNCHRGHRCERYCCDTQCIVCAAVKQRRRYGIAPSRKRERVRIWDRANRKNRDKRMESAKNRSQNIADLIAVLRKEMPELLKEFGL